MQGIVTGASRGLGLALTRALAERGWDLVVDARDAGALESAVAGLEGVVSLAGDVADPDHRRRLVEAVGGPIDLLVNNASLLGPSPQPALSKYPLQELRRVYEVNPGAMRWETRQEAFPGEDIPDRPPPEESVPGILALIEGALPSGLYRARDLVGASACPGWRSSCPPA